MSFHDRLPTLVMGARGSIGRWVLEGLREQDLPVRASTRRPDPDRPAPGVDRVVADLADPSSLVPAFAGVGQVFLYARLEGVDGVIDAARTAGVRTIVLLSSGSVIHPSSAGNAITEEHRAVEDAFAAASDLAVVPVRPLVLATNALGWSWSVRAREPLPLYRPDALTAPVHERDVAAVAVAALSSAALQGSAPPEVSGLLTGPTRTSQRDQVAAIGAATGTEIRVAELDRAEAVERWARFMPEAEADAVARFLDDAAAGGSPATGTVAEVLGRAPLGFDAWAVEHADDFR